MDMVKAKLVISKEGLMHGVAVHLRHRSPVSRFVPVAGGALVAFATILLVIGQQDIALSYALPFGILCLLISPVTKWNYRRVIKSHMLIGKEMTWTFDETYLVGAADNGFEVKMTWASMQSVLLTPQGILVYPQKNTFHWIPASAFSDTNVYHQAIQYVKQHVKDIQQIA
jgi:hypothetical protein